MSPAQIMENLQAIERDLALRQNLLETAARNWFLSKRDKEYRRALEFLKAEGTIAERNAVADQQTALHGRNEEAEYEALRAVVRVMDTRATICQSVLKAMGRA